MKKCLCCGIKKEVEKNELCLNCLEWLHETEIREQILKEEYEERNQVEFTYFD